MADVARLAEVKLPAISNWRRRYESFPRPERRNSRNLFRTSEIAEWLDHRRIAKHDLKESEFPGMSYGARFRRNLGLPTKSDDVVEDALWQELFRCRGATDFATHADLVLGLLYVCVRDPAQWADLVSVAERRQRRRELVELAERAMEARRWSLPHLHRALSAALAESGGDRRLGEIIRLLERARSSYELGEGQVALTWGAQVFEYLHARFAAAEGKRGAVIFTPASVVEVLVESVVPSPGDRVLDPCCDSGSLLAGAARYVEARGGRSADLSLYGQALLERSWWLAKANLELHGLVADLGPHPGSVLREDLHRGRRFDVVLTNPPFNISGWSSGHPAANPRWPYGPPPESNGNFAWLQHVVSSLGREGRAAVLMANGASSSEHPQERAIRAAMVQDGVVEALIALPPQLFYSTAVPVTLWLLRRPTVRPREDMLFIDARALGSLVGRTRRILTPPDIRQITGTYHAWRARARQAEYEDVPGFSASVTIQEIQQNDYRLAPGSYVAKPIVADSTAETVFRLRRELDRLHARSVEADASADQQLKRIGTWRR